MTSPSCARVLAPAKINLGIEILGKRPDGFHEIRSVLAMVDLVDDMRIARADHSGIRLDGMPGIALEDNLIARAVSRFTEFTGLPASYDVAVTKRIPAPAGLGSASSNAAATLLALNTLHGHPVNDAELHALASDLGSDAPFFLGSPVAAVSGRGTELEPLPALDGAVLIAVPRLDLAAKTSLLYGKLTPADFSDGSRIASLVETIRAGEPLDPTLLSNAFARPLDELVPSARILEGQMREAGCTHVALSGAGPAHYSLFENVTTAERVAVCLREIVGPDVAVIAARFRTNRISVEHVSSD